MVYDLALIEDTFCMTDYSAPYDDDGINIRLISGQIVLMKGRIVCRAVIDDPFCCTPLLTIANTIAETANTF